MTDEQLADELRALSRSIAAPPVADGLPAAVLDRVAEQPIRRTFAAAVRSRWRALVSGLLVLLAGLALTPPVRATVADWLNLGGVVVRTVPSGPTEAPEPPAAGGLTLAEAAGRAGFTPLVPTQLGTPDGVEVSPDRRIVAMSWRTNDGVVRLEEFRDQVSMMYVKRVYEKVEIISVGARTALWFKAPHDLVVVDEHGVEHTERARAAGPTLVWEYDGLTLRLEGVPDQTRAVAIAETVARR
ncbi:MAG TPA: hypothetical protein VFT31_14715 [Kribbella sp.]|nr:hypothetical protein [Kribbella sp.]